MVCFSKEWRNLLKQSAHIEKWWQRMGKLLEEREAKVVRVKGQAKIYRTVKFNREILGEYLIHLRFLIQQKDRSLYIEERMMPFQFHYRKNQLIKHTKKEAQQPKKPHDRPIVAYMPLANSRQKEISYDRLQAVKYAERWWDRYNPEFINFPVNCTNYVSQCLLAGGAPMVGEPDQEVGWWYSEKQWSLSWAVAHSMRWYLSGSERGLQGREVETPEELNPGDIICYDFQGDERWDHTTIVVDKDANNMPLVNAHTDHSRHRYWSYEDSTAWTTNIQYKFFQINDTMTL